VERAFPRALNQRVQVRALHSSLSFQSISRSIGRRFYFVKVVGLNRVRLDEYPVEAIREAFVNAVAHRQYDDAGRKIILEVFADRVIVSSPGLPPEPITLSKLRKGNYRPCSRNPVLAQCLSYFHRIEERGSGFLRMRDQMLNHGLDQPLLDTNTGYFQVHSPDPATTSIASAWRKPVSR
jgi:ATP-dependent DNA helicase RecG